EALFDELPYAAPGGPEPSLARRRSGLLGLVTRGRRARRAVPTPRAGGPVPRHLVDALRRGLSQAPGERWPSMAALLAELRRDPGSRRRRRAVAALAALAAAAAAGAAVLALARSPGPAP